MRFETNNTSIEDIKAAENELTQRKSEYKHIWTMEYDLRRRRAKLVEVFTAFIDRNIPLPSTFEEEVSELELLFEVHFKEKALSKSNHDAAEAKRDSLLKARDARIEEFKALFMEKA